MALLLCTAREMQNYRRLLVWKKSHRLALKVYRLSQGVWRRDRTGIVSQMRRASLSIPANIVEGCMRGSNRDFAKYLQIAIASSAELEYHLRFAMDAGLLDKGEFVARQRDVVEVRRMLVGLLKRVRQDQDATRSHPKTDD